MTIEVSVIIPAYNTEAYICQAVDSALGQTLANIEVIVVDDASSDGTLQQLRHYEDSRLKILVNETNCGVSYSRNRALSESRGKWVAILDSDDWYAPDRLESLLQAAYAEKADIVADDVNFIEDGQSTAWSTLITESGNPIDKTLTIDAVFFVKTSAYDMKCLSLGLSKPIFKRAFLVENAIRYHEDISKHEDYLFYLECLLNGGKFILLPKPYYFYRSRAGSLILSSVTGSLERFCTKLAQYLDKENVARCDPDLAQALSESIDRARKILAYQKVIEPIKEKRYADALIQLFRNPYFTIIFLSKLSGIIERRFKYYFLGDDSAFTRGHLKGKN